MNLESLAGNSGVSESRGGTPMESSVRPSTASLDAAISSDFQQALALVSGEALAPVSSEQEPAKLPAVLSGQELPSASPTFDTDPSTEPNTNPSSKHPEEEAALLPDPNLLPALFIPSAPATQLPLVELPPAPQGEVLSLALTQPTPENTPAATVTTRQEAREQSDAARPTRETTMSNALDEALATLTTAEPTDTFPEPINPAALAPEPERERLRASTAATTLPATAPTSAAPAPETPPQGATSPSISAVAPHMNAPLLSAPALRETLPTPIRLPELPQQLFSIARRLNEEGNQELRVRLDPPHLGELNVVLESGKEGISIRIVAQTRETLLLLQDQRATLQDELSQQDLSIASFTASLAGDASGQRSHSRFFDAPTHHSRSGDTTVATNLPSLTVRIPHHAGELDAHA